MNNKKLALVLGGGSALGFAHIGVIKTLEKYGIVPDIVVGTSMGALVGAAYASGVSTKDMIDIACKFRTINFFDVNFKKEGIFSGNGLMKIISKFLPDKNIENLDKSFACVACDLKTESEHVFKFGSLRDAVRSSISIPGILVPVEKDDMLLIDGGVINNLPEDVALEMGADIIISVDVLNKSKIKKKRNDIFEIMTYALNICTKEIQKFRSYHSDILICPDTSDISQLFFTKTSTLKCIKAGENEAKKYIDDIIRILNDN